MAKWIAITGNSGKTTLSYLLCSRLADKQHRAVLLATEGNLPTIQLLLPPGKENTRSLGKALSAAIVDHEAVLKNMIMDAKNHNFGILSYASEETSRSYPDVPAEDIAALYQVLDSVSDYVVVDTCNGPIDRYILERGATALCIISADEKGLAYRRWCSQDHAMLAINAWSPENPLEEVRRFTHPACAFPWCRTLTGLYSGRRLADLNPSKAYEKELERLLLLIRKEGSDESGVE